MVSLVATGSDTEVGSELAFDQEKMYCGTVCARGIVEVLDKVYQAGPLVKELGGNVLLKEVKEEQPERGPGSAASGPVGCQTPQGAGASPDQGAQGR